MVYNSVDEMLIEPTPFATRHGERRLGLIGMRASLQLREAHRAQTRINMQAPLAGRTRLTIAEACELFGIADTDMRLETRFVIPVERLGGQRDSRAEAPCIPASGQVTHHHHVEVALSVGMIDHRRIAGDVGLIPRAQLKPCQVADVDVPSIGFGPSRAVPAWPAIEVTEVGVPAELTDDLHVHRADAIDDFLLAAIALDRQVL